MTITVRKVGSGATLADAIRPDLPTGVGFAVVAETPETFSVSVTDTDAARPDAQSRIVAP